MTPTTKYGDKALIRTGLNERAFLDYAAASRMTSISIGTLRWLVHEHRIPHLRLGPRTVRFERRTIESWIAARRVPEI